MNHECAGQLQTAPKAAGPGGDLGVHFQLRDHRLGGAHTAFELRFGRKPARSRPDREQVERCNQRSQVTQHHTLRHRFEDHPSTRAYLRPCLFLLGYVTTAVLDDVQDFATRGLQSLIDWFGCDQIVYGAINSRRRIGHCCTPFLRMLRGNLLILPSIRLRKAGSPDS